MNKDLITDLSWGASILVVALAATWARQAGHVDADTVTRLVVGMNGLMVASFGNRMPKTFVPDAFARRVRRVGGWSFVISGLIYTALFVFAPLQVAALGGSAAVVTGIAVTIGYCLTLRAKAKASTLQG